MKRLFSIFKFKRIFLLLILVSLLSVSPLQIKSEGSENSGSTFSELQKQLNDNLKRQRELENQIKNAQNQQRTLSNQISLMENEIALTELKIDETENRIAQLAIDVANTENKLGQLEKDLSHRTNLANKRIRAVYEQSFVGPLELFLKSEGFNNYLLLQKYTDAIYDQDVRLITSLKELKETYQEEKTKLSDQKKNEEELKAQLDNHKISLNVQKQQKSTLLAVTKNNEQVYQGALAQAKVDQQIIQQALANLGTRLGPVNRGDIIAFQGNTGCSSGTHLHFGYLVNTRPVDPAPYINSGTLTKPMDNYIVTQPFGANAIPGLYGPGGHPAIDMQGLPLPGWNTPIKAAKAGTAFLGRDNGCPGFPSYHQGPGKGIIIDHHDGTKTIYWHIR